MNDVAAPMRNVRPYRTLVASRGSRSRPSAEPAADPAAVPGHDLPSVGVVIPTRDRPDALARALAAVLAQDYAGQMCVAVVFDQVRPDRRLAGSPPRPLTVLSNLRTPGFAGARNTGVLSLDTDLVAFCDDDNEWLPSKITAQVSALSSHPGSEFATCATEVEYAFGVTPRFVGKDSVVLDDLVRSRMAMIHSSTFIVRRDALVGTIGLIAEDAPGSDNEDWDLLLRAAKRAAVVHVDEPLVRARWPRRPREAYEFAARIAALRWMIARHPEIRGCRLGAAPVYAGLARASATAANRRDAWYFRARAIRNNWRQPRSTPNAAATGAVSAGNALGAFNKRDR